MSTPIEHDFRAAADRVAQAFIRRFETVDSSAAHEKMRPEQVAGIFCTASARPAPHAIDMDFNGARPLPPRSTGEHGSMASAGTAVEGHKYSDPALKNHVLPVSGTLRLFAESRKVNLAFEAGRMLTNGRTLLYSSRALNLQGDAA